MSSSIVRTPVVLLVDHDIVIREQYQQCLTEAGYSVLAVADGTTAIKRLARYRVDLVVLDYTMHSTNSARMSSGKLARIVRRWKKSVPMIMTGTHPNIGMIATQYRANGAFRKGGPLTQLTACIDSICSDKMKAPERNGVRVR